MTFPPYLQEGDTIGIVCPAGYMPLQNVQTCINTLQSWGFTVKTGSTVGSQFHYFSGTDEERLQDLQQMLDDTSIKAILCGRGGYGISRIIDQLNFDRFTQSPKWLIGYSDVTVLLSHLVNRLQVAAFHSPMASAFNNNGHQSEYVQALRRVLTGTSMHYSCAPHHFNKPGTANGILVGGNLAILSHLIGTPSDVDTRGKILFVEDIGEYIYNVDRMFYHLKRSGKLDHLAGLIVGQFTDMKDTTIPFGESVYSAIKNIVAGYQYPVCFNFPVGHTTDNYPLKVGANYNLQVQTDVVGLSEA